MLRRSAASGLRARKRHRRSSQPTVSIAGMAGVVVAKVILLLLLLLSTTDTVLLLLRPTGTRRSCLPCGNRWSWSNRWRWKWPKLLLPRLLLLETRRPPQQGSSSLRAAQVVALIVIVASTTKQEQTRMTARVTTVIATAVIVTAAADNMQMKTTVAIATSPTPPRVTLTLAANRLLRRRLIDEAKTLQRLLPRPHRPIGRATASEGLRRRTSWCGSAIPPSQAIE